MDDNVLWAGLLAADTAAWVWGVWAGLSFKYELIIGVGLLATGFVIKTYEDWKEAAA